MLRHITGAALALLVAGCFPESDNPIGTATIDPDLAGRWTKAPTTEEPKPGYLEFVVNGDRYTIIFGKEGDAETMEMEGLAATAGDGKFLSVRITKMNGEAAPAESEPIPYWLVRYRVENGMFIYSMASDAGVKAAIQSGALKGNIPAEGSGGYPHITSSSEELAAFFGDPANAKVFETEEETMIRGQ